MLTPSGSLESSTEFASLDFHSSQTTFSALYHGNVFWGIIIYFNWVIYRRDGDYMVVVTIINVSLHVVKELR